MPVPNEPDPEPQERTIAGPTAPSNDEPEVTGEPEEEITEDEPTNGGANFGYGRRADDTVETHDGSGDTPAEAAEREEG